MLAGAVAYFRLDLLCVVLAIAIIGALSVWATAFHTKAYPDLILARVRTLPKGFNMAEGAIE